MSDKTEYSELVLCLGSNCGNREATIMDALEKLKILFPGMRCSDIYETPAVAAGNNVPSLMLPYLNAVAIAVTMDDREKINANFKKMERDAGRNELSYSRGEVPLDIDIVCYGGTIIKTRDFSQTFFKIGYDSLNAE